MMTLKDLLEFLFTKGVPMVGVYWVLDRPFLVRLFEKHADFFDLQLGLSPSVVKRATAMILSSGLGVAAFSIYAALGYSVFPAGFEEWFNLVAYVSVVVYSGSQAIHMRDLGKGK
jgi:hypothetical protein